MCENTAGRGPYLVLSTHKAYRTVPFEITCVVPHGWMEAHNVTAECIAEAASRSFVLLDKHRTGRPVASCSKCSLTSRKPIISVSHSVFETAATEQGKHFLITRCVSNCNSSRLHLGDMVVVVFPIRDAEGGMAAKAFSEPLNLMSQSGYKRPPETGGPPRIQFIDIDASATVPPVPAHALPQGEGARESGAAEEATPPEQLAKQAGGEPGTEEEAGPSEGGLSQPEAERVFMFELRTLLRMQTEQLQRIQALNYTLRAIFDPHQQQHT
eukprot:m51a1_g9983 hypothetical protein (269) ;mRNA; f:22944-24039